MLRRSVAEALWALRAARRSGKGDCSRERVGIARAYRELGVAERAEKWFRSAVNELSAAGDTAQAEAVSKEMSEVIPQERRNFDDLAARFAATSTAAPSDVTKIARPPQSRPDANKTRIDRIPVSREARDETIQVQALESVERVLEANDLLKVYEADELGIEEDLDVSPAMVPLLVPTDVLKDLHARGEIDFIEETSVTVAPVPEPTPAVPGPAVAVAPPAPLLPSLVPVDVLEALHAKGEIDLFDEQGRAIEAPPKMETYEVIDAIDEVLEEDLDIEAEELGAQRVPDEEEVVEALSRVPLFAELDRSAFVELAKGSKLRTLNDRQYLFREGEEAASFFVVGEGALEVVRKLPNRKKEIVLSQFHHGQAFGIFGLFAGQRRAASARAIGHAEVIEISGAALTRVVEAHPAARNALSRFYKERLLENFLASSPIFDSLDAVARGLLIGQFRDRRLAANEKLVSPGEVFNGLFLVITGELEISKRLGGGRDEVLAQLDKGQFFGVVSALSGTPCRCDITAVRESTITLLPQRAFNEFVKDYPALRLLPQRLAQEGLLVEKDVFVGGTGIAGLS